MTIYVEFTGLVILVASKGTVLTLLKSTQERPSKCSPHYIIIPTGEAKDYDITQEHNSNDNCLMGYKHSYNLPKPDSM